MNVVVFVQFAIELRSILPIRAMLPDGLFVRALWRAAAVETNA